jgi:hypothetical protein
MSENDSRTGPHVERVTLTLAHDQRAALDREAVRRSVEAGRPVTRSAVARDLLARSLPAPTGTGEAAA